MMKKLLVAGAAFASIALGSVAPITPAAAQDRAACLRNNRIYGWDVVNPRTMIVTDRQRNRFMVRLSGGCIGLDNSSIRIAFRTATNLGCLQRGDRIAYRDFALGRPETCFVQSVEPIGNRYSPNDRYNDRNNDRNNDRYNDNRGNDRYNPYNR
jgi:hypothetical protein